MGWYLAKLVLLLPLLALLIWASLKLAARLQAIGPRGSARQRVRLVETSFLAPGLRLAVIEFHGREILLGASRQGLVRLAEAPARAAAPDDGEEWAARDRLAGHEGAREQ